MCSKDGIIQHPSPQDKCLSIRGLTPRKVEGDAMPHRSAKPRPIRIGILAAEPIRVAGLASIFDLPAQPDQAQLVPVIGSFEELLGLPRHRVRRRRSALLPRVALKSWRLCAARVRMFASSSSGRKATMSWCSRRSWPGPEHIWAFPPVPILCARPLKWLLQAPSGRRAICYRA